MIDTHHGIIAWFARNHVAANLLMLLIIGCGLISAYTIRIQVTPEVESQADYHQSSLPRGFPRGG